jgi:metal-responsive CopG/Arc/MetJ family transcriptional regulator
MGMAAKKMDPADDTELVPFNFRIPRGLVVSLDAMLEELRRERPAFRGVTRSDIIREALYKAVQEHEEAAGKVKKKP